MLDKGKIEIPKFENPKTCSCGTEFVGPGQICPDCLQKQEKELRDKEKEVKKEKTSQEKKQELLDFVDKNAYFKTIPGEKRMMFIEKVYEIYGQHIDILLEFKQMDLWLMMNDNKRYVCYDRFILNWLSKSLKKEKF